MLSETCEALDASDPRHRERWEGLLQESGNADVYFLPEYLQIYERKGDGAACCFAYRSRDGLVLYPFMLRPIGVLDGFGAFSEYADTTTPYGYGGPLYSPSERGHLDRLTESFLAAFASWCQEKRVVSEFMRLHPLLGSGALLPAERVSFHHETIHIDLALDEHAFWNGIRKGHKSSIKRAQRMGVSIAQDVTTTGRRSFHDLYIRTMERQSAAPGYFFPASFFEDTLTLLGEHACLFTASHEEEIVSAAIILRYGPFVSYHFSGSNEQGLRLCANHLLLFEVAKWAKACGGRTLHLGGGLAPDDSLTVFKTGFSPQRARFCTYRHIHNPDTYAALTAAKRRAEAEAGIRPNELFFPRYRA